MLETIGNTVLLAIVAFPAAGLAIQIIRRIRGDH